MLPHKTINYIEYPASDLDKTKAFFETVFNWEFTDYGPDYTAFKEAVLEGGFYRAPMVSDFSNGAALIVFYSNELEQTQAEIVEAGGLIVKPTFDFPGGRRFHFREPSGNEFAVWSDK